MKKIILISILMLGFLTFATAQIRLDTIDIYKKALKAMNLTRSDRAVKSITDRQLFNNINLSNPSYNTLDTTSTKFWHKKDWSSFLTKIDTSNIKNYALKTNDKPWFTNIKKGHKTHIIISFSPIIFNNDNNKAICMLKYTHASSGGAIMSLFFEKLNNVWITKEVLQLALLD